MVGRTLTIGSFAAAPTYAPAPTARGRQLSSPTTCDTRTMYERMCFLTLLPQVRAEYHPPNKSWRYVTLASSKDAFCQAANWINPSELTTKQASPESSPR